VPDGSGGYMCKEVWASDEISPTTVPKMSLGNGLVYFYTKYPREDMIDAWYFTAVDFETGDTVWRVLTGTGLGYNNNYAPITIGPQGGTAYIGTLNGLVLIRDTEP
jgi:outer membrane protein assembly factor BamB